ncbi:MAG TPA: hypothetical protein VFW49_04530 [Fluviicoccus sp.]|nr:hypothetical protein [Fluviicoccus sp.]
MKTVADLFANHHVVLGKTAPSDRHFVHVEKMPSADDGSACIWVKSVEPGQLQNEYWVAREKNLLLLLKKLPQVVHLRKDDENSDSAFHTVRTRDAGLTLDTWLKLKPQHIASGRTLEHPFAHVGAFLRLTRGLLTALKSIHREGVVHANIDSGNLCLPYEPFPFRFDGGIRPDYTNICLIDFMFAISSTLRLYRPLPVTPLAAPSGHSTQLRHALETDAGLQRAEAIQEIDYSVDLYALGHLLEDIFQRGLIYPGNMQSQMEMTIYNLIHELLGFDEGIPAALAEKYGSTLPHDIYIKRIDNMLTLDPHVDNNDHDILLLDPAQVLDPEAPEEEVMPVATPHQPAEEPHGGHLPADPLLVTASPESTAADVNTAAPVSGGLTSYLEINKWMVVFLLVLVQGMHFIYQDGDKMNLDILPSLLLMVGIAAALIGAALLAIPRDNLLKYVAGDDALTGGGSGLADPGQTPLRDDEYISVNAVVIVALLLTGQISSVLYEHGDSMGLDVMPSILLTLLLGGGLSAFKIWYDKFVTPKPLVRVTEDEDQDTEIAVPAAVAASVVAGVASADTEDRPDTPVEAAADTDILAAAVEPEPAELSDVAAELTEPEPVAAVAAVAALVAADAAAVTVAEAGFPALEPEPEPEHAETVVENAPADIVPETPAASNIPVVTVETPDVDAPPPEPAPAATTGSTATTGPEDDAVVLPLAARTGHPDEAPAAVAADGSATAAEGHLELDNRVVIVVVLLLMLAFFYFSMPRNGGNENALPPAPAVPEVAEAPVAEDDLGLPEAAPALEPEAPAAMPADSAVLDDLLQSHAPAARAARPKPAKAVKPGVTPAATETAAAQTAAEPAATETEAAPAEATPAAVAATPAAAEAAETPVAEKPAEKPAVAVTAAPARPLGNPLAQAQNIMGWYYFKGINNVPKDHVEALKWFHKSAQLGDPSGQFNLGMMYANGYGIGKNQTEAARWFKLSADQGKANAQLNLGLMYLSGRGVPQNTAEGMRLLRLSAEQGDKNAQANLDAIERSGKALAP